MIIASRRKIRLVQGRIAPAFQRAIGFQRHAVPPARCHHHGIGQIGGNNGLPVIIIIRRLVNFARPPRNHFDFRPQQSKHTRTTSGSKNREKTSDVIAQKLDFFHCDHIQMSPPDLSNVFAPLACDIRVTRDPCALANFDSTGSNTGNPVFLNLFKLRSEDKADESRSPSTEI